MNEFRVPSNDFGMILSDSNDSSDAQVLCSSILQQQHARLFRFRPPFVTHTFWSILANVISVAEFDELLLSPPTHLRAVPNIKFIAI